MTLASPPTALAAALDRVDALADRTFSSGKVPGLVYGVVLGDGLIHTRALGTLRVGEEAPPDSRSVFRIASMTKSFTAATVLALRDEGLLGLDDPIGRHVPELAAIRLPTADSPPITIRHLLTMTAGLPSDDPWGDRQQSLDLGEFSRLLAGGLSFARAPGTAYEYSNLGYGILGRLITNVAGREYREVVRQRLLDPLGMTSTGYLESEFEPERVARGYLWRDDGGFVEEGMDGYGALASMGGIFTTVEDLARWVVGFLDAEPPRDGPEAGHPLSRATRREMQRPVVPAGFRLTQTSTDAAPHVEVDGYGYGLFMIDDARIGRIASHGGGYPGFGSHMRWHPASGLGIIVLANHRYAPATLLARDQLRELVQAESAPVRRIRPSAATEAAGAAVEALIADWNEGRASELFAMNVELDEPLAERRATIDRIRERHGALRADSTAPTESHTSFHLAWWLVGDRGGRVRVEILLTPELPPKVQTFAIRSVPEPSPGLVYAAERIVAAIGGESRPGEGAASGPVVLDWPSDVVAAHELDVGQIVRAMRATEARFAPIRLGPVVDGDGERTATFRLLSDRGSLDLALALDLDLGCVTSVSLVPLVIEQPDLD